MSFKKHVLIVVPDGVGIKNYLYSKIPLILATSAKITIWSTLPLEAFDDIKRLHGITFNFKQIRLKPENWQVRLYREATTYARLKHYSRIKSNPTILTYWRPLGYNVKVKVLYKLAELVGNWLTSDYLKIVKAEQRGMSKISVNDIDEFMEELKGISVDTILFTHQRVPGLFPICIAAKNLNISTVTAVFSWDNLPKARLAIRTDKYLVWSEWMKNEMCTYYPEISESKIVITGTPQFEFYSEKERLIERQKFADKYNLDSDKYWICFSGDDELTSPYDPQFLFDVAKAIAPIKSKIQIVFRRCPVDFSNRYDDIIDQFNDVIRVIDPAWNINSNIGWTAYYPKYNDIGLQVNIAYHCALVINLGSTMALDFATFNKPCFYLNYNPSEDLIWSTEMIYNYEHFRSMNGLDPVGWINSPSESLEKITLALDHPESIAVDRQKWMERLVLSPVNLSSDIIVKELL